MRLRLAVLLVVAAGIAGLVGVLVLAPDYLLLRGFPLDDAWIHAVYARSLAHSGTFSYNPGIPATGATSPLWTVVLAVPQLLTSDVTTVVLLTKLLGFGLHVAATLVLLRCLSDGAVVRPAQLAGAMLVAVHPDLVSASMSGMEVPLANLVAAGLLLAATGPSALLYGAVCFLAPLARPELSALCVAVPVALFARRSFRHLGILLGAAFVGNAVSLTVVGLRNLAVSGRPLPAAFYAKFGKGYPSMLEGQVTGWTELLARFPVADSSILLVIAAALAASVLFARKPASIPIERAAAGLLAGLAFCAVSFAAIPPVDPRAFYNQRYVLPVLPLLVGSIPVLILETFPRRLLPARTLRLVQIAVMVLLTVSVVVGASVRYPKLANDARNIDDVQVAIGKQLEGASPDQTVWAVDAGAVRYFGNAFVVDLMGLNSVQMLGPDASRFLDTYSPQFIETVAEWVKVDLKTPQRLQAVSFRTSTRYTATSFAAMQQHWIVVCNDPAASGQVVIRERRLPFRCAHPVGARSAAAAKNPGGAPWDRERQR